MTLEEYYIYLQSLPGELQSKQPEIITVQLVSKKKIPTLKKKVFTKKKR
jgi:hypothetical protein